MSCGNKGRIFYFRATFPLDTHCRDLRYPLKLSDAATKSSTHCNAVHGSRFCAYTLGMSGGRKSRYVAVVKPFSGQMG